jgi:hypothetical protein
LIPKEEKFFVCSRRLRKTSWKGPLLKEIVDDFSDSRWVAEEDKAGGAYGDFLTHDFVPEAQQSFITHFDREDIYAFPAHWTTSST